MTISEYTAISGRTLDRAPTQAEINALMVQAGRALAVRRSLAVREIKEQAEVFDDVDRKTIIEALGGDAS